MTGESRGGDGGGDCHGVGSRYLEPRLVLFLQAMAQTAQAEFYLRFLPCFSHGDTQDSLMTKPPISLSLDILSLVPLGFGLVLPQVDFQLRSSHRLCRTRLSTSFLDFSFEPIFSPLISFF